MKRLLLYLTIGWAAILTTIICFVDFDRQMQPLLQISDYLMTFYVGGNLVAHNQLGTLYPPPDSLTFAGMPFDVAAHALLPKMPASSVAEFMYMPMAAAVFVPFSMVPLNWSLFLWQLSSLAALFASVQCFWMARTAGDANSSDPSDSDPSDSDPSNFDPAPGVLDHSGTGVSQSVIFRCLSALLLLPVCLTLWIGQVGLVFGMLPLSVGYYLLCRKRPFTAGLIWSLAVFKPQFLVPACVMIFALLVRKQFRSGIGLLVGLVVILSLSIAIFTPALNLDWLRCLKISDIVYSDPRSGVATQIATSLPRTLILLLPGNGIISQSAAKSLIYGLAAILLASALFAVFRSRRLSQLDDSAVLRLAFLLGIFMTPLVMPHFFLYDYCLFALTLPLVFFFKWPRYLEWSVKKLVLVTWVVINIYATIVMAAHQFAFPLIFMLAMLGLYIYLMSLIREPVQVAPNNALP